MCACIWNVHHGCTCHRVRLRDYHEAIGPCKVFNSSLLDLLNHCSHSSGIPGIPGAVQYMAPITTIHSLLRGEGRVCSTEFRPLHSEKANSDVAHSTTAA